jgi:hypothetical protein
MGSVSQFIEKRLKLKVNRAKSAVDYPTKRKFLGFSFYYLKGIARIRVQPKSYKVGLTTIFWITCTQIAKRPMNGCNVGYACAIGSNGRKSVRD